MSRTSIWIQKYGRLGIYIEFWYVKRLDKVDISQTLIWGKEIKRLENKLRDNRKIGIGVEWKVMTIDMIDMEMKDIKIGIKIITEVKIIIGITRIIIVDRTIEVTINMKIKILTIEIIIIEEIQLIWVKKYKTNTSFFCTFYICFWKICLLFQWYLYIFLWIIYCFYV